MRSLAMVRQSLRRSAARVAGLIATTRARLGDRRGVAAVEMAMIMPTLIVLLAAVTDFSEMFYRMTSMRTAIRAGTQYALVDADDTAGMQAAAEAASGLDASDLTVTTTIFCECSEDGSTVDCTSGTCTETMQRYVTVDATVQYEPIFGLFLASPTSVDDSLTLRIE